MLTVKAIYSPNQEEIFEALRVWTVPLESGKVNVMLSVADTGGELGICTEDCAVYVMNDKGKTIASYY